MVSVAQLGKEELIGACVSGGLDSKTISKRLTEEGLRVLCFSADLGQPDEDDIQNVQRRMATCGVETVIVDLKDEMAEACFDTIQAQARYDGGYWNSTGIGRYVTCRGLLREMKTRGVTVLSHGATGRGNDQMRFERYTNVLAPEMKVYAPWRDPVLVKQFPGRKQMAEYLQGFGIEAFVGPKKKYSTDANLAGLSHEAEDLESIETPMTIVRPEMGVWPHDAPAEAVTVTVRFERARCVSINGEAVTPLQAMQKANKIGGTHGVGLSHALENRIIGTKSRGVYEAPGMELLGKCLEFVYQAILDRRSAALFRQMSRFVADQIYDGRWFDPSTKAAMRLIQELSWPATGTVTVQLYKGNILFVALKDCPHSIYNEEDASMEESSGLNPVSSQGYAEIQSVEARSLARAGLIDAYPTRQNTQQ